MESFSATHLVHLDPHVHIFNFRSFICKICMLAWQGWIILSDNVGPIEKARALATQLRWEARVIDPQNGSDQRLLVCQKPFVRK